jgi:hypothetical protein
MDEAKVVCLSFMSEIEDPHLISKLSDPLVLCLNMGGNQSKLTPLQCIPDNFKKRRGTYNLCCMLNIKSVNLIPLLYATLPYVERC